MVTDSSQVLAGMYAPLSRHKVGSVKSNCYLTIWLSENQAFPIRVSLSISGAMRLQILRLQAAGANASVIRHAQTGQDADRKVQESERFRSEGSLTQHFPDLSQFLESVWQFATTIRT